MPWFLYAFLGALGDASYHALVKRYLKNINRHILAGGVFLFVALFTFIMYLITGETAHLNRSFWIALIGTVILNYIASLLIYQALALTDLSLVQPLKALTPLFLLFTSYLMLGEAPTLIGGCGVVLIVLGSYILNFGRGSSNLLHPFKTMWRNKGIRRMLLVAFIFSFTANFDKQVVQNSTPIFALFATSLSLGLCFLITSFITERGRALGMLKSNLPIFILIALVSVVGGIAINIALSQQIVPYVTAIKRLSALFAVIFGWWFFQEPFIRKRLLGASVIVAGAVLIIFIVAADKKFICNNIEGGESSLRQVLLCLAEVSRRET